MSIFDQEKPAKHQVLLLVRQRRALYQWGQQHGAKKIDEALASLLSRIDDLIAVIDPAIAQSRHWIIHERRWTADRERHERRRRYVFTTSRRLWGALERWRELHKLEDRSEALRHLLNEVDGFLWDQANKRRGELMTARVDSDAV